MSFLVRVKWQPLRSLGFASISGVYMGVGAAFDVALRMLVIENLTNQTMLFSFDGVTDNFVLPAGSPVIFDFCSNKTIDDGFFIAEGTRVYVKDAGVAPTSGSVYVAAVSGGF